MTVIKWTARRGRQSAAVLNTRGWQSSTAAGAPTNLSGQTLAGPIIRLTWTDNSADNTNFSVQRRDATAGGAFAEIFLVGANVVTQDDPGAFTAGHRYQYQIVVVGGLSNGLTSNSITVFEGTSLLRRQRRSQ